METFHHIVSNRSKCILITKMWRKKNVINSHSLANTRGLVCVQFSCDQTYLFSPLIRFHPSQFYQSCLLRWQFFFHSFYRNEKRDSFAIGLDWVLDCFRLCTTQNISAMVGVVSNGDNRFRSHNTGQSMQFVSEICRQYKVSVDVWAYGHKAHSTKTWLNVCPSLVCVTTIWAWVRLASPVVIACYSSNWARDTDHLIHILHTRRETSDCMFSWCGIVQPYNISQLTIYTNFNWRRARSSSTTRTAARTQFLIDECRVFCHRNECTSSNGKKRWTA